MAGASYKVEIEDGQARAMFARLLRAGVNMKPLFTEIGSALKQSTKDRFLTETDPEGNPWVELSPVTRARKKTDRKLYESSDLFLSIEDEPHDSFVDIIAGQTEYAAVHQLEPQQSLLQGPARAYSGSAVHGNIGGRFGRDRRRLERLSRRRHRLKCVACDALHQWKLLYRGFRHSSAGFA
jgi:phage gpG-like protein